AAPERPRPDVRNPARSRAERRRRVQHPCEDHRQHGQHRAARVSRRSRRRRRSTSQPRRGGWPPPVPGQHSAGRARLLRRVKGDTMANDKFDSELARLGIAQYGDGSSLAPKGEASRPWSPGWNPNPQGQGPQDAPTTPSRKQVTGINPSGYVTPEEV